MINKIDMELFNKYILIGHKIGYLKIDYTSLFNFENNDFKAQNYLKLKSAIRNNLKNSIESGIFINYFEKFLTLEFWNHFKLNKNDVGDFYDEYLKLIIEVARDNNIFFELKVLEEKKNYIIFDSKKINIKIDINKVEDYLEYIRKLIDNKENDESFFYRGHSNFNYNFEPTFVRNTSLIKNEGEIFRDVLLKKVSEFDGRNTNFEILSKMRHYGVANRLIDITSNPLIALYFACENNHDKYAEIIILKIKTNKIRYPGSSAVEMISTLPRMGYKFIDDLKLLKCNDERIDEIEKISKYKNILRKNNVDLESKDIIEKVNKNYIVMPFHDNERLINQKGAFVICGINENFHKIDGLEKNDKKNDIVIINSIMKKKILKYLSNLGINKELIYPELEHIADFLNKKYSEGV